MAAATHRVSVPTTSGARPDTSPPAPRVGPPARRRRRLGERQRTPVRDQHHGPVTVAPGQPGWARRSSARSCPSRATGRSRYSSDDARGRRARQVPGDGHRRRGGRAIARAVEALGHTCDQVPMADGGEGTLDVLGGANRTTTVTGPLGEPVEAGWRLRPAPGGDRDGPGLGPGAGRRRRGQRPGGRHHRRDRRAHRRRGRERRHPRAGGGGRVGHHRRRAGGAAGAVPVAAAAGGRAGGGLRRAHRASSTPPRCSGPRRGPPRRRSGCSPRRLERLADVYLHDHGVDVRELEGSGAAGGLAGGLAAAGARLERRGSRWWPTRPSCSSGSSTPTW